jgi:ABC-type transport system substrate-binding protein
MTHTLTITQPAITLPDPHDCTDNADTLSILHAVFDTLIRRNGHGFVPHLATGWSVSADARTFTFHLRANVRFHDGHPLDAQAVCANLTRLARADKGYTLGAPGVWHQYLGQADIRAVDALTLTIKLPRPIADLCDVLAQCFMISPHCFAAFDAGVFDDYIGSGLYKLGAVTADKVTATANAGHFQAPPAHSDIHWCAVPLASDRLARLRVAQVDIATRLPQSASDDAGIQTQRYVDPVAIIYLFNCQSGPLQDPNLRRALHLCIDREGLIRDVLEGAAVPLYGFVSSHHFGAPPGTQDPFDPEAARRLLAASGYADGLVLTVDCPTRLPDEAQALTACLAQQLEPFGIELNITLHHDREAYAHMVRRKEIGDLCVFDSSPMSTFRVIYEKLDARVAGSWWQGYRNPKVEAALDAACATPDDATRAALYRDVYTELQRDPPWLYLYNPTRVLGGAKSLAEFEMAGDGVLDVAKLPCMS